MWHAWTEEERVSIGNHELKKLFWRVMCRWGDNIKMELKLIECDDLIGHKNLFIVWLL
jgi:hypothetical protein